MTNSFFLVVCVSLMCGLALDIMLLQNLDVIDICLVLIYFYCQKTVNFHLIWTCVSKIRRVCREEIDTQLFYKTNSIGESRSLQYTYANTIL
jgi:hypothetical protein